MATQPRRQVPSFASIMDMPMDQIQPPKPMPAGEYMAQTVGHAEHGQASTGTPFVTITLQYLEALESVNSDDLRAALAQSDGTVAALNSKTIQTRLYLTEGAAYRNKVFLTNLGVDPKLSINEAIQQIPGRQVIITVTHRPNRSGEGTFAEVTGTAKVE